jgi:hypothetical protein
MDRRRSIMSKTALSLFPLLLSAFLLTSPAAAQTGFEPSVGLYRAVDDETGREALARLELGQLASRATYVLLTLYSEPMSPNAAGSFTVFAGFTTRGGLGNILAQLKEARRPLAMLRRPALLLQNPGASLKPEVGCFVELSLRPQTYSCYDLSGNSWSGRLIRLR